MMTDIKDSGKRDTFSTGAVRDGATGKGFYDCLPYEATRRVALVYEGGAEKYGKHNCKKGMPLSRYFDAAMRHLHKAVARHTDEDHLAMAMWNIGEAIELLHRIDTDQLPSKLDDVPDFYGNTPLPREEKGFRTFMREAIKIAKEEGAFDDTLKHDPREAEEFLTSIRKARETMEKEGAFDDTLLDTPLTAYLSHPIRGEAGDSASPEVVQHNLEQAVCIAEKIREAIPGIELYCPAEHEEVVNLLWRRGTISAQDILLADCEIVKKRDILIVFSSHIISDGMKVEISCARDADIPVFYLWATNTLAFKSLWATIQCWSEKRGASNESK